MIKFSLITFFLRKKIYSLLINLYSDLSELRNYSNIFFEEKFIRSNIFTFLQDDLQEENA